MFSFSNNFRETAMLVNNFVKRMFHFLRVNEDSKNDWFSWMLSSANNGKLNFWFPAPFRNYQHPVGPQLKKRVKELTDAQKSMIASVGNVKAGGAATKMVMDA